MTAYPAISDPGAANGLAIARVIDRLLAWNEPSVRYKTLVGVLGENPSSPAVQRVQEDVRVSPRVQTLLSLRDESGDIPFHPYTKWFGSHWTLEALAELGYPPGDESLLPLRDEVLTWLLGIKHWKQIRTIDGRVRRCASQEALAVYSLLTLGLADSRVDELVDRLLRWQWPDGGWNCDKHPHAINSSFMESLIPLRALVLYAKTTGSPPVRAAAERAADIFLKRRLYKRVADGTIIRPAFVTLHYPCYWHYDILAGLKVMAEAGFIHDPRCQDALDLLESKRLPDGGFPAEERYYRTAGKLSTGRALVNWGGVNKRRTNEWVTVDALTVLRAAGRA